MIKLLQSENSQPFSVYFHYKLNIFGLWMKQDNRRLNLWDIKKFYKLKFIVRILQRVEAVLRFQDGSFILLVYPTQRLWTLDSECLFGAFACCCLFLFSVSAPYFMWVTFNRA